MGALVDEWQALRAEIREQEETDHPPIIDALGRVWTWWQGDIYRHDGMAWPADHIGRYAQGWPSIRLIDNPNYHWCDLCLAHAEEWIA